MSATDENFEKIIDIKDILSELGIPSGMPVIGWVFKEKWGEKSTEIFKNFLKASDEAKQLMLESDDIWNDVRPFMNASNDKLFVNLRVIYREGIPRGEFSKSQLEGSKKLYSILSKIGGKELVGKATELSPGTFWRN